MSLFYQTGLIVSFLSVNNPCTFYCIKCLNQICLQLMIAFVIFPFFSVLYVCLTVLLDQLVSLKFLGCVMCQLPSHIPC